MLNNVVNRLYALGEAFSLTGNEKVSTILKDCCDIIDDEIQKIESNFAEYETSISNLENPMWCSKKPIESGYYLWKEIGKPSCNMDRTIVKIKAVGLKRELFISFNETDNTMGEAFVKLEKVADREWLKVGEL